jgi:hypothetical protein
MTPLMIMLTIPPKLPLAIDIALDMMLIIYRTMVTVQAQPRPFISP